jgi:putative FmdB family regulatory protein
MTAIFIDLPCLHHEEVRLLPVYEFECTCCPSRFELKRSFNDEDPVHCPRCGGKARKLFSPVPIIFKGSGFYVTDVKGSNSFTSTTPSEKKSEEASGEATAKAPAKVPAETKTKAPAATAEKKS